MTEKKIIRFNLTGAPVLGPPASVDRWYDRHSRVWVIQTKDSHGHQLGNATHAGSKREAVAEVRERMAALGLDTRRRTRR